MIYKKQLYKIKQGYQYKDIFPVVLLLLNTFQNCKKETKLIHILQNSINISKSNLLIRTQEKAMLGKILTSIKYFWRTWLVSYRLR